MLKNWIKLKLSRTNRFIIVKRLGDSWENRGEN